MFITPDNLFYRPCLWGLMVPRGPADCLDGVTIVISGVLNMQREEAKVGRRIEG